MDSSRYRDRAPIDRAIRTEDLGLRREASAERQDDQCVCTCSPKAKDATSINFEAANTISG